MDANTEECFVCKKPAGGAHNKCKICKKIVHVVCGIGEGEVGYGQAVVCFKCKPQSSCSTTGKFALLEISEPELYYQSNIRLCINVA